MEIKELRQKYTELYGKKPLGFWNDKVLEKKINDKKPITQEDSKADKGLSKEFEKELESVINSLMKKNPPVYKNDLKPYMVLGDEYVPYDKAKLVFLNSLKIFIDQEIKKLNNNLTK